jgi:putative heme-binding domain-containing protein
MSGRVLLALAFALSASSLHGQLPVQSVQSHPGEYAPADIAYGARLYDAQCATCHGANGDGVGGVDLKSGKFRTAVTDQDLNRVITNGVPGTGMLAFRFDTAEIAGVIAYLRNMNGFDRGAATTGDPGRGRAVFEGRGGCLRCHRVDTNGSRVAPNLSDIGAIRSAASLERSLVEPNTQMMPINRPVRIVTLDGRVINGRRLNEDTYSVQIIDDQERLASFTKSDLREYTILTASPMPSFKAALRADELSDLLAYLLSLKGTVTP